MNKHLVKVGRKISLLRVRNYCQNPAQGRAANCHGRLEGEEDRTKDTVWWRLLEKYEEIHNVSSLIITNSNNPALVSMFFSFIDSFKNF